MKVALVVHDYNANFGQGRYCIELVKRLHNRVKFLIFANTFEAPIYPGELRVHVPAIRLNALATVFSFIRQAETRISSFPSDLIHAQGLTCWNTDIITGHICNSAREKKMNTKWIKPRLFMKLVIPFERRFYQNNRAQHLISISNILDTEIRNHYRWNKPSSIIYHGTDQSLFRVSLGVEDRQIFKNQFRLTSNRWTWLFMGEASKGLRQCIEQISRFENAQLLVVSRSRLNNFKIQASRLGVSNRVIFHGFESCPQNSFRAVDLFLYPSDYDPFGMVVTEAMSSGLPVVVGSGIGAAELIDHGTTGFLCDPHCPDQISSILRQVEQLPDRGSSIGRDGRKAISHHNWDACADQTFRVYEEALSRKANR